MTSLHHTQPLTTLMTHTNQEIKLQVKANPKILLQILRYFSICSRVTTTQSRASISRASVSITAALGITHISNHCGRHPKLHQGNCKPSELIEAKANQTHQLYVSTHPLPQHKNSKPVMKHFLKKIEDLFLPSPV